MALTLHFPRVHHHGASHRPQLEKNKAPASYSAKDIMDKKPFFELVQVFRNNHNSESKKAALACMFFQLDRPDLSIYMERSETAAGTCPLPDSLPPKQLDEIGRMASCVLEALEQPATNPLSQQARMLQEVYQLKPSYLKKLSR